MDERLRLAYVAALRAAHDGQRVEIHMGSEVLEYLRELCTVPDSAIVQTRCWGMPVVTNLNYPPDHLSVHAVTFIV